MRLVLRVAVSPGRLLLVVAFSIPSWSWAAAEEELAAMYERRDIAGLRFVASTGDAEAATWLGLLLQNRGEWADARVWFRQAAHKGQPFAITSMGDIYRVERNYSHAAYWYRFGAVRGIAQAQAAYAQALLRGQGVAQSYGKAAYWFTAAGKQKHPDAFIPLAELHATGRGVGRDLVEAVAIRLAGELVIDDSQFSSILADEGAHVPRRVDLSYEQMPAADRRAQVWLPGYKEMRAARSRAEAKERLFILVIVASPLLLLLCTALVMRSLLRRKARPGAAQPLKSAP